MCVGVRGVASWQGRRREGLVGRRQQRLRCIYGAPAAAAAATIATLSSAHLFLCSFYSRP